VYSLDTMLSIRTKWFADKADRYMK